MSVMTKFGVVEVCGDGRRALEERGIRHKAQGAWRKVFMIWEGRIDKIQL